MGLIVRNHKMGNRTDRQTGGKVRCPRHAATGEGRFPNADGWSRPPTNCHHEPTTSHRPVRSAISDGEESPIGPQQCQHSCPLARLRALQQVERQYETTDLESLAVTLSFFGSDVTVQTGARHARRLPGDKGISSLNLFTLDNVRYGHLLLELREKRLNLARLRRILPPDHHEVAALLEDIREVENQMAIELDLLEGERVALLQDLKRLERSYARLVEKCRMQNAEWNARVKVKHAECLGSHLTNIEAGIQTENIYEYPDTET